MDPFEFTLLSDGSSDAVLIHPIRWLLEQHCGRPVNGVWADLRHLKVPPKELTDKIRTAYDLYPCDVLFVHRDAENEAPEQREKEIADANQLQDIATIPVIPIRMQEAWLLISEDALREAAGNPEGSCKLSVPKVKNLESIPNPKVLLHDLLKSASELHGRRLKRFKPARHAYRLGELIEDYSLLRQLKAFERLENQVIDFLQNRS